MRTGLKIGGIGLLTLVGLLAAYIALLAYPGVLFAHSLEHGSFTVYSEEEIPGEAVELVERIETAIARSAIYDPLLEHTIIFAHGSEAFDRVQDIAWYLTSRLVGIGRALTYNRALPPHVSQAITFRLPAFSVNELLHPEHFEPVNMTQILSHEVVHTLLAARLGLDAIARYPPWKIEGYADYVASRSILDDAEYAFADSALRVLRFVERDDGRSYPRGGCRGGESIRNEEGYGGPACYYVGRVLMEYALEIRGMSFDEVMSENVTDVALLGDLAAEYGPS